MSSFRPIAPLTPLAPKISGHYLPDEPPPSSQFVKRRGRVTVQACLPCRHRKGKCDGIRPTCGPCVNRKRSCAYETEPGQSSMDVMKARLASLEDMVNTLQKGPIEEAESMLRSMRASHGEPDQVITNRVWGSHQLVPDIPDAITTQAAIDGFFTCSGKLFHVFSPSQAAIYYRRIFHKDSSRISAHDIDTKVAVCCLSAIATTGCQYVTGQFSQDVEDTYYTITKFHIDAVIENRPLDAIKLCTLIAMYNIMNKATVALAYIEIGLSMSRRYHLDDASYRKSGVASETWVDYRRTWRTLMFLSSWISATLGYVSGNEALCRSIALSEMDIDSSEETIDIVQTQMAKIALLKSQILRVHMAFKELSISATRTILDDLERWHDQVPLVLQLNELYRQGPKTDTVIRRSIYHVHLLYLGAIILLFRRLASQSIRAHGIRNDRKAPPDQFDETVYDLHEKGIMSARQSARMIGLLHEEDGVFRKCWLVIFHSYASCVILLHSVAQKQLFKQEPETWAGDLELAHKTLLALEYCGGSDHVAADFYQKLRVLYDDLMATSDLQSEGDADVAMEEPTTATDHAAYNAFAYCLGIPTNAPPKPANNALSLLAMLCRPFGDNSGIEEYNTTSMHKHLAQDGLAIADLGLDIDVAGSFAWDVEKIGVKIDKLQSQVDGDAIERHHFLDSWQPSGWSSEPRFMTRE